MLVFLCVPLLVLAKDQDSRSTVTRLPIQVDRIAPVQMIEKEPGHLFFDFGETSFGGLELTFPGAKSGQKINVSLGEILSGPQTINRKPGARIRFLASEITLVAGQEKYRVSLAPADARRMPSEVGPVMPFRYVEVEGAPPGWGKDGIYQLAAHYPFDDQAAHFQCSDSKLNAIWDLCHHTIKATSYCGVFIDGDRERKPYEADAYIDQLGWYCCTTDFTLPRYSHEYLMLHPTWPTEWIMFSVLMAWEDYQYTGDTSSLKEFYPDLKAKTLLLLERPDGLISTVQPPVPKEVEQAIHIKGLRDLVDWPVGERDGYEMKPINTVVNAFHCIALKRMAQIATALNEPNDAHLFETAAAKATQSLNQKLVDPATGLFVDGEGCQHSSLPANVFPLAFGLVAPENEQKIVAYLGKRDMACSVYGAQFFLEDLFDHGLADHAIDLMTADNDRSWTHMLNLGATLTLEAWDNKFKPNQDWNHAWGAAPANLIPRKLMGITPLEPGFAKVLIQPEVGDLSWAEMRVPTVKGSLFVRVDTTPAYRMNIELPPATVGRVGIPWLSTSAKVLLDGQLVSGNVSAGTLFLDNLAPGKHTLQRQ